MFPDGHGTISTTHRAESAPKLSARQLVQIMTKAQGAAVLGDTKAVLDLIAEAYDLGAADATKEG